MRSIGVLKNGGQRPPMPSGLQPSSLRVFSDRVPVRTEPKTGGLWNDDAAGLVRVDLAAIGPGRQIAEVPLDVRLRQQSRDQMHSGGQPWSEIRRVQRHCNAAFLRGGNDAK